MKNSKKLTQNLRLILLGFLVLTLGVISYSISYLFIYKINDLVMSLIALIVLTLFVLFEGFLTIKNYSRPLGLERNAFTDRGTIHPIPLITMILISVVALGLFVPGLVIFFIKTDLTLKSYCLILVSTGTYILLNCLFYVVLVLSFKKIKK